MGDHNDGDAPLVTARGEHLDDLVAALRGIEQAGPGFELSGKRMQRARILVTAA